MRNYYCYIWLTVFLFACGKRDTPVTPPVVIPGGDTADLVMLRKNITIANWNIAWFGDAAMFKGNLDTQYNNTSKIIQYLGADLYGFCEIVDTARFGRLLKATLGNDYRYQSSPFPNAFLNNQRMVFAYNRHIFRNVTVRPYMGLSGTAYASFSNGRYPFLLSADLVVNDTRRRIHVVLMHAKAGSTSADYTRRQTGAAELKDSLDSHLGDSYKMIIGDYNDHLTASIVAGITTSPYRNFVADNDRYHAITALLEVPGNQSTLDFSNSVIDHQVISANMKAWYMSASARIRTDVVHVSPHFTTGNTSDHYPITSSYTIR